MCSFMPHLHLVPFKPLNLIHAPIHFSLRYRTRDHSWTEPSIQTAVLFPQNSAFLVEGIFMTFAMNIITIISDPH